MCVRVCERVRVGARVRVCERVRVCVSVSVSGWGGGGVSTTSKHSCLDTQETIQTLKSISREKDMYVRKKCLSFFSIYCGLILQFSASYNLLLRGMQVIQWSLCLHHVQSVLGSNPATTHYLALRTGLAAWCRLLNLN